MEYQITNKPAQGAKGADLLLIEGNLTIQHILAIRQTFQEALSCCHALELRVKSDRQLDFSFLQLLLSLKVQGIAGKKPVYFNLDLDEENQRLLAASGLDELLLEKN